jgi:uracil-DNA glycosylase
MNERQAQAMERLGLPKPQWPTVPKKLADEQRRSEIEVELHQSAASVLITLGDQPLRWFTKYFGSEDRLGDYGETAAEYGRLHAIRVGDHDLRLLPLVHPRQADKLGNYSPLWWGLHERWRREVAPQLL